ncbi:hypothetical protein DL765_010434 [Monosporascus sp. GIB2]|nr:hypothetical protein DL765_010434 [Monosporascus sp. GIB2]
MSTSNSESTSQQLQARIRELERENQRLNEQVKAASVIPPMVPRVKPKRPEPYDGKRNPQTFLTQARIYLRFLGLSDIPESILAVGVCLTGDAADWFEPIARDYMENTENDREISTSEIFSLYTNFEDKLRSNFGNSDEKRSSAQKILDLKQKGPASKYAVNFKILVAKAGWGDKEEDALIDIFYKGLKDDVKDEIIRVERTLTLDEYIGKAVKIDNRQFERRQERQGRITPGTGTWNNKKPRHSANTSAPRKGNTSFGTEPGPMEIGTIQRKKDWSKVKCYNCKKMGHTATRCKEPKQSGSWTLVPEGRPIGPQGKPFDTNMKTFAMIRQGEDPTGPSYSELAQGQRKAKKLSQAGVQQHLGPKVSRTQ